MTASSSSRRALACAIGAAGDPAPVQPRLGPRPQHRRLAGQLLAGRRRIGAAPATSSSGKWTSPRPRSARGSSAQRSASVRVAASSRRTDRRALPGVADHLLGDLRHLLAALERALGVAAADVAGVQRDQPSGGVEHVGDRGVGAVDVADRVGEHRRHPLGERRGRASGRPGRRRRGRGGAPPRATSGVGQRRAASAAGAPGRGRDAAPPAPGPPRTAGPAAPPGHRRRRGSEIISRVVTGAPRSPARWVALTSRHSAAQPARPWASRVTPGVVGVDGGAAAGRGPPGGARRLPAHRPGRPGAAPGAGTARPRGRPRAPAGSRPARRPGRSGPRRRCRPGRSGRGRPCRGRRPARPASRGARPRAASSSRRPRAGGRRDRARRLTRSGRAGRAGRAGAARRGWSRPPPGRWRRPGAGRRPPGW